MQRIYERWCFDKNNKTDRSRMPVPIEKANSRIFNALQDLYDAINWKAGK